jgi:hypothetical protein
MSRALEQREKRARIKALLEARGLDGLAASITASGGRLPGSKRVSPNNLGSGEITLADPVISDLNSWSQKLGLENIS